MKFLKYFLLFVIVMALVFFGKGLLTPSISCDGEIIVNKPAQEAWAVMSDESNLSKWIKGFVKTEHISGTENTVGAVSKIYIEEKATKMVMEETITALTPNELMAMTFTMDFMDIDYEMTFNEQDGKTTIRTKTVTSGNGIFAKSMVSFMSSGMKKQEDENLNNLKNLIDGNSKNYFPVTEEDTSEEM